ncbi:MAG: hypothetical protein AAGC88_17450, partial [Bacteroidota bacterium]
MQLTTSQQQQVNQYLDQQGLNFQPLRSEIEDHLLSDLESRMQSGQAFEEAWQIITHPINDTHFSNLQQQTMASIQKRLSLSNFLINVSIGLLLLASLFKVLHFPGTTMLMLGSLLSLGISFLATSISGIRQNVDNKKRTWLMILTLSALLLFWTSWLFAVIQLPGMVQMKIISIMMLLAFFPLLQHLITQREDSSQEMIVYLHEKASKGIERLILVVLLLATMLKLFSISMNYPPQVSAVFAIMVLIITGFHLFATTWQNQYIQDIRQHSWLKLFVVGLFVLYLTPALGSVIPLELRAVMVLGFYLGMGYLVFFRWNHDNTSLGTLSYAAIAIFLGGWFVHTLGWADGLRSWIFNFLVLASMGVFVYLSRKEALQHL